MTGPSRAFASLRTCSRSNDRLPSDRSRWIARAADGNHRRQGHGNADLLTRNDGTPVDPGAGPGVAPHTLPLDVSQGKDIVLKLGRPGRVVGIVRTASGAPLADVPVELWVRGSGTLPAGVRRGFGERRITPDAIVRPRSAAAENGPSRCISNSTHPAERFELPRVHPARRVCAVCLRLGDAQRRTRRDSRHSPSAAPAS